jgi:hypothetical protein
LNYFLRDFPASENPAAAAAAVAASYQQLYLDILTFNPFFYSNATYTYTRLKKWVGIST